mgnify:FL=1
MPVYLGAKAKKIGDGSVSVALADGTEKEIKADSVIVSVGYEPAPIAKKGPHIHVIGDAERVGNLRTVVWGAWKIAEQIGKRRAMSR